MIPTSFPTLEPSIQPTFPPTLSPTITANPSAIGGIPTTRRPVADIRPDSTSTSKDWDKWGPGWWGWKDDDDWSRPQWKPEWTSSPKHTKSEGFGAFRVFGGVSKLQSWVFPKNCLKHPTPYTRFLYLSD